MQIDKWKGRKKNGRKTRLNTLLLTKQIIYSFFCYMHNVFLEKNRVELPAAVLCRWEKIEKDFPPRNFEYTMHVVYSIRNSIIYFSSKQASFSTFSAAISNVINQVYWTSLSTFWLDSIDMEYIKESDAYTRLWIRFNSFAWIS